MSIQTPETDINIRDLALNEPAKPNIEKFDPHKEIYPEDWQREGEILAEDIRHDSYSAWTTFFGEASLLKFIDPTSLDRLGIDINDYQYFAESWFKESQNSQELSNRLANAFVYKFLYPKEEADPILSKVKLDELFDPEFHLSATQANALMNLYYLDPDLAKSTGAFERLHDKFNSELTVSTGDTQWRNLHDALMLVSALKVLYPDEPIKPWITNTLLEYGRNNIEQNRRNPRKSASVGIFDTAMKLMILTADEVTIEDGEFKLENKSSQTDLTQEKLPETRRF